MSSIGQREPFDPLKNLREDLQTALSSYEKHIFSKETHLSKIEEKINQLFIEYSALENVGYLPAHINQELYNLATKINNALSQGTFFRKAKESTLQSLDRLVEKTLSNFSNPLTPALWAGSLAKRGKEEDAFNFISSLTDPKEQADALIEMAKNGSSLSIIYKAPSLPEKTLVSFMHALETHKDSPILENMLYSLPASVALTEGIDQGFSLVFSIRDPDLQANVLAKLVRSEEDALTELIDKADKLPKEEGNRLLQSVASAISMEMANPLSDEEILDLSDLISSLNKAQKPDLETKEKTPKKGFFTRNPTVTELSKKTAPPILKDKQKNEDTVSLSSSNLTKTTATSASILKDEQKSEDTDSLSSKTASATEEPSAQPYTLSNKELVEARIGGNLFPVFHQMIGNLPITNLVIKEGINIEDGDKISFSIEAPKSKKVPAPALKSLLKHLGATDMTILAIQNSISVNFPKDIKMMIKYLPCHCIEFDPSTAITFSLSSGIASSVLSGLSGSSGASIRKIFYTPDAKVVVEFDKIKKGAWSDEGPPPVNLGQGEALAMPFWKAIWDGK